MNTPNWSLTPARRAPAGLTDLQASVLFFGVVVAVHFSPEFLAYLESGAPIEQQILAAEMHSLGRAETALAEEAAAQEAIQLGVSDRLTPVNGRINIGGGSEPNAHSATNVNPMVPNTGGAEFSIPNHVPIRFEEVGGAFKPQSADLIYSNRLPYEAVHTIDWSAAAQSSAVVLRKGGSFSLNVWTYTRAEAEMIADAFRKAGFNDVSVFGEGTGTMIKGRK